MNKSYANLPTIVVTIEGEQWTVIDPEGFLAERARLSRPFVLPCKRCHYLCTDVGPCLCHQMEKRGRPYDLQGSHGRFPEALVLETIEAALRRRGSRHGETTRTPRSVPA